MRSLAGWWAEDWKDDKAQRDDGGFKPRHASTWRVRAIAGVGRGKGESPALQPQVRSEVIAMVRAAGHPSAGGIPLLINTSAEVGPVDATTGGMPDVSREA